MTRPSELSAVQARNLLQRRDLSALELLDDCLARIDAVDPAINAVVARDIEGARKAAQTIRGDEGPLAGLPLLVKDMVDVAGLPTTFGSELFATNMAKRDDPMVAALRAAGALPFGKTNCPEWSAGGNTRNRVYGVTGNPHDVTRSAAGSSGGSAAALAAFMAPLATGSDTGGSLRNPAAFCGVVGFRPTPGVVPAASRSIGLIPMSTVGPMARNVADAALLLSVQARADAGDPFTPVIEGRTPWDPAGFASLPEVDPARLRLAFSDDFGFAPTEAMIRRSFGTIIDTLTPMLPGLHPASPDCTGADKIFSVLRGVLFLGPHRDLVRDHPGKVGPNVTANVEEGLRLRPEEITAALIEQQRYSLRWHDFFGQADYVLSPAVCIGPRDWHELFPTEIDGVATKSYYHWLALAYASTLAGCPSLTIPCGRDENNMPFGLQIIGRRHDDRGVLALGLALERMIAGLPSLCPTAPDMAALVTAPPIRQAPGAFDLD
ncbi:amidase [Pararhodobacter zhoushanensis]|uniref:Amidase n=1 Tax=Pararhodobacter zhoushanensis TaxID=2479545 RepID=A0ABT3H5F3_9RHOB|nr:amidase [Pararhodobacter zhoushanensis]MCW1935019.1 amidase [Pararhodobacter zhoushanensis]